MTEQMKRRSTGKLIGVLLALIAFLLLGIAILIAVRPNILSFGGSRLVEGVRINPHEAVGAGAQWRIVSQWQGGTELAENDNFYVVEFKPIPGWETPAPVVMKKGDRSDRIDATYRPVKYAEQVILRLAGASTIGSRLAPELAQFYLSSIGADEVRRVPGKSPDEINVQGIYYSAKEIRTIVISSKGTPSGFAALKNREADLAMAARPITDKEAGMISSGGELLASEKDTLFALDAVSVVTQLKNPVKFLTLGQLKQIFSGEISDWSQVGGPSLPIKLFVLGEAFGTRSFFEETFLGGAKFSPNARVVDIHGQVAEFVAQDASAIGFCSVVLANQCKELALKPSDAEEPVDPSPQNIKSGKYPGVRKMFLYPQPDTKNVYARDFIRMARSSVGQGIVKRYGFVPPDQERAVPDKRSTSVDSAEAGQSSNASVAPGEEATSGGETLDLPPLVQPEGENVPLILRREALLKFRDKVQGGTHWSQPLHFLAGSSTLDVPSMQAVDAIVQNLRIKENENKTIIVVGFTDSYGSYTANQEFSRRRALAVAEVFKKRGVRNIETVGLGEENPLAPDDKDGRNKNKRVEIWIK